MTGEINNPYQAFISKSRYSKWIESETRRETWQETVDRYVDYMQDRMNRDFPGVYDKKFWNKTRKYIFELKVMPSMRGLMTAGPALDRSEIAIYNCSFIAIDDTRAFDEALFILMNGVGLGFSAEAKFVSQLPQIPSEIKNVKRTIVVEDSKEGWAQGYRELIESLYAGELPAIDITKVRGPGKRLKTFGGRSSGPQPLIDLFDFTILKFQAQAGKSLSCIDAHDIFCKIGEVVVVGGVRRSALISLTDLNDYEMAKAKSGAWWEANPQRALANNSAVYESKPSIGEFLQEWGNLYESKSGERGIFNKSLAQSNKFAPRREGSKVVGTNPSLAPGTLVYTTNGIKPIEELEGEVFTIRNLDGQLSEATCWKSGEGKTVYEVRLSGGHKYYATEEHKWPVLRDGVWVRTKTTDISPGDQLKVNQHNSLFSNGTEGTYDEGFLIGWNLGDGWQTSREQGLQIGFIVSDEDRSYGENDKKIEKQLMSLGSSSNFDGKDEINVNNTALRNLFIKYGVKHKSEGLPSAVWDSNVSDDFRKGIIDGLFSTDGSVNVKDARIHIGQASQKMIKDISDLLGFFGIQSNLGTKTTTGRKSFGWKTTYDKEDKIFTSHTLRIGGIDNVKHFADIFKLSRTDKQEKINVLANRIRQKGGVSNVSVSVVSVEDAGESDVWDISVNDVTHAFELAHCVTGNCGEINLRNAGLCNLTEVIVEEQDDIDSLVEKIEIATALGTIQSTFTKFHYIRDTWQQNAEEERLLGVSLTGQFGNELLSGRKGKRELDRTLKSMKSKAIEVNKQLADSMGINVSAAITTVKPSGTVSQLTHSSAGMHPWHSEYYIRSVRADNNDPLNEFMKSVGIPSEPDVMKPDNTTVFYFPIKAPEGAVTRNELTAIEHLDIWLAYKKNWTEHNPSVTISVREEEWIEVANWVYDHWEDVGGLSFLPHSDHTYRQAPYQECDETTYRQFLADMPTEIDWSELEYFEFEDNTSGSQTLSCVSGQCEVVDLSSERG